MFEVQFEGKAYVERDFRIQDKNIDDLKDKISESPNYYKEVGNFLISLLF